MSDDSHIHHSDKIPDEVFDFLDLDGNLDQKEVLLDSMKHASWEWVWLHLATKYNFDLSMLFNSILNINNNIIDNSS